MTLLIFCISYLIVSGPDGSFFLTTAPGFSLTERTVLLFAAVILAAVIAVGRLPSRSRTTIWPVILLLGYIAARALLSSAPKTAGFLVDLRDPMFLLAAIPAAVWVRARGPVPVVRLLLGLAILQAALGVIAYTLLRVGLLHGYYSGPLGIYSTTPTIVARSGSEFLVPWALVATPLRATLHSRRLYHAGTAVLVLALIFSGTLTNFIGVVVGFVCFLIFGRSAGRIRTVSLAATGLVAVATLLYLLPGSNDLTSRFDLAQRSTGLSATYREAEFQAAEQQWLGQGLGTAAVGAGPGSVIAFLAGGSYGFVVKNDTHNAYVTVGLKFGILGLLLLATLLWKTLPFAVGTTYPSLNRAALRAGLVTLLFVSITAPYLVGSSGYVFLAVMMCVSRASASSDLRRVIAPLAPGRAQARPAGAAAPAANQPVRRSSLRVTRSTWPAQ